MGLKAGWLALFLSVWIIGAFLGSTFEYNNTTATWAGSGNGSYSEAPATTLSYLMNVSNAVQRISFLGNLPIPVPNGNYFSAAFKVIAWQWSFMAGYEMFYWIVCAPFVAMGVLSMILLVYGVVTGNFVA